MKKHDPFLIGLTDSVLSPIAPYCNILFQIPEKFATFIDTNAAYMALIHALAFGVYLKDPEYSKRRMEEYDSFVKKSSYYEQDHCQLIKF
jgi:DNA-binding MurR/RpiR family transcriptional regulator